LPVIFRVVADMAVAINVPIVVSPVTERLKRDDKPETDILVKLINDDIIVKIPVIVTFANVESPITFNIPLSIIDVETVKVSQSDVFVDVLLE